MAADSFSMVAKEKSRSDKKSPMRVNRQTAMTTNNLIYSFDLRETWREIHRKMEK